MNLVHSEELKPLAQSVEYWTALANAARLMQLPDKIRLAEESLQKLQGDK